MELLERLQSDMKAAMKSGEKDRLGVLRMLISDVKNIDLAPKPTTAQEAVAAYAKKLRKSREEFQRLGKTAEAERYTWEIEVVESYLPKKASPEETAGLVESFLGGQSFTEKQIGQATGAFMKAHGSQVDPATASRLIRERLAGK